MDRMTENVHRVRRVPVYSRGGASPTLLYTGAFLRFYMENVHLIVYSRGDPLRSPCYASVPARPAYPLSFVRAGYVQFLHDMQGLFHIEIIQRRIYTL